MGYQNSYQNCYQNSFYINFRTNFYNFYYLFEFWFVNFYNCIYSKFSKPSYECFAYIPSISIFCNFLLFAIILFICIFAKLLHFFRNIVNLVYILSSRSVRFNFNKDITYTVRLKSNINSHELWIIFQLLFYFYWFDLNKKVIKK